MTKVVKPDQQGINAATDVLVQGGLLVYPTETFYALGADHQNSLALERLLILKGRNASHTLPLILSYAEEVDNLCEPTYPIELVRQLAQSFWPGPLTLILPARPNLHPALTSPPMQTGSGRGVAVRLSSHSIASQLAKNLGRAIISTSANVTGKPATPEVRSLDYDIVTGIDMLLDGGACTGGLPSTILDLRTVPPFKIIRQGAINVPHEWLIQ